MLFLAVLAGGDVALDYYSERGGRAWRLLVTGLGAFVTGLGILRFLYLVTVGAAGAAAALVGATLFTAAVDASLDILSACTKHWDDWNGTINKDEPTRPDRWS